MCIFIILTPNFWSTPRNSYCPRVTCDKHSVPPYRGETLWQISGSLFNHPVHSQSGQCILLLVHCISLLKTMTGNWECPPHKLHIKMKFEMLCMIYKLTITKHQKVTRSFSVKCGEKQKATSLRRMHVSTKQPSCTIVTWASNPTTGLSSVQYIG